MWDGHGRSEDRGAHVEQLQRELAEREQARDAALEDEERAHERRADKHAYLSEKLAERARSEEEGASGDADG